MAGALTDAPAHEFMHEESRVLGLSQRAEPHQEGDNHGDGDNKAKEEEGQEGEGDSAHAMTPHTPRENSSSTRKHASATAVEERMKTKDDTALGEAKRVSFGVVSVRLHLSTLGDNPAVTSGVPVGLGDEWFDTGEITVSQHLQHKSWKAKKSALSRRRSRYPYCKRLTREERVNRCIQSGYTLVDVKDRIVEVQRTKEERVESLPQSLIGIDWDLCMHDMQTLCFAAFQNIVNVGSYLQELPASDDQTERAPRSDEVGGSLNEPTSMAWMPTVSMAETITTWFTPLAQGFYPPQETRLTGTGTETGTETATSPSSS